jgi:lipopolysaccharide assembly protein A
MLLSLMVGLILGAGAVFFVLQNMFFVTVTFLSWELTTSLAVIISVAILIGFVVSSLLSVPSVIKNIFIISKLKKENKNLSEELNKMHIVQKEILIPDPTIEAVVLKSSE